MHLIIDEAVVSNIPDLLPLVLEAWPGKNTLVSSAPLLKCLAAVDNRSADAAIVRLQGIDAHEIGKLMALPLATSVQGTMLLHAAGNRAEMFVNLRDMVEARQQSRGGDGPQVWL